MHNWRRKKNLEKKKKKKNRLVLNDIYACFGCVTGGGGCALKHCNKNAVYVTKATAIAIKAYINIFNSGCLNRFFLNHSNTSVSDCKSPLYILGNRLRKYTIDGKFVTPHFLAYLGSAILTNVISKLSVSLSIFSNFSNICLLSSECDSSVIIHFEKKKMEIYKKRKLTETNGNKFVFLQ